MSALRGRCTQILLCIKLIYFTETTLLRCSKMEWERTKVSKLFPNISLTKYDNKNSSWWLTKVNLVNIYIQLTVLWNFSLKHHANQQHCWFSNDQFDIFLTTACIKNQVSTNALYLNHIRAYEAKNLSQVHTKSPNIVQ